MLLAAAAALGIFEITERRPGWHEALNALFISASVLLITAFSTVIGIYVFRQRRAQDDDEPGAGIVEPGYLGFLTGAASALCDDRPDASTIAALHVLLSLGRGSPQASGAAADVVQSFLRRRLNACDDEPQRVSGSESGVSELAIRIWSQLAERGFDSARRLDLSGLSLRKFSLQRFSLAGANLAAADLSGANLTGSDLSGADLTDADLSYSVALATRFNQAVLAGANLADALLGGADFSQALLSGADLRRANLRNAVLEGALLANAQMAEADLTRANLSRSLLIGADLAGAILDGTALDGAAVDPDGADALASIGTGRPRVLSSSDDLRIWVDARRLASPGGSDE